MTLKLKTKVTENPDFSGFKFYVEEGRLFDIDIYCEAYGLDYGDVDEQSWKAVQDDAGHLYLGQWLEVYHEVE